MPKKEVAIKHSVKYTAYLLVIWGFYRFLFKQPEEIEELVIKPLVWLVPIYILLKKEKLGLKSVGFTSKNIIPAVYLALGLGIVFAIEGVVVNIVKYGGADFSANIGGNPLFSAIGISLATSISEEVAFRGYLFPRIWSVIKDEWKANILVSLVWALIHLPIAIIWWKLDFIGIAGYLLLTTMFGIGSAFLYARTKNIVSPIILHVLWEWPIILFR